MLSRLWLLNIPSSHFNQLTVMLPSTAMSSSCQNHPVAAISLMTPADAVETTQTQPLHTQRKRTFQMVESAQIPLDLNTDGQGDDDPVLQLSYCKVCKQVLPFNAFYPSRLTRKVYHCKGCEKHKQTQRRGRQAGATKPKVEKDEATYVFARFWRRCATERTSVIEDERFAEALARSGEEPGGIVEELDHISNTSMTKLQLAFDVKITRQLLSFWNHASALSSMVDDASSAEAAEAAEPLVDVEAESSNHAPVPKRQRVAEAAVTLLPTTTKNVQLPLEPGHLSSTAHTGKSHSTKPGSPKKSSKKALCLILWNKARDTEAVQPWEVIPVTFAEAADFRNAPSYIRPRLIAPHVAAALADKLSQLRELLS